MQTAVSDINCSHPDTVVTELRAVLEHLGDNCPDAEAFQRAIDDAKVIRRAIDRLEEIASEMAKIERGLSNNREYAFGKLEEV